MDAFKICQSLQTFAGKNSSSAVGLFEFFCTADQVNDLISNPRGSYHVVSSAPDGNNDVHTDKIDLSPMELSKRVLASILDISLIDINLKVSIYHQFWIKQMLRICLGEKIAGVDREDNSSAKGVLPVTFVLKFRFTNDCDLVCHQLSITNSEQRSGLDLQSLMAYALVKPLLTLDWGMHKYDPSSLRDIHFLGPVKDPSPRIVNLGIALLKKLVRVFRAMNRSTLRCTAFLLDHIQKRISTLESRLEDHSGNQITLVEKIKLKRDYFIQDERFRGETATVNMFGWPHQPINLSQTVKSMKKFGWRLTDSGFIEKIIAPQNASATTIPEASRHGSSSSQIFHSDQKTRIPVLDFRLAVLLQVFLLAMITEIYFILFKLPIPMDSIFKPIIAFALAQIKPGSDQDDSRKPKLPQHLISNKLSSLSFPLSSPGRNSINSILRLPSPLDAKLALPYVEKSDLAKTIKIPKNIRSVSWGATSSESGDPTEVDSKFAVLKETKNRKLLPKSPNPKAHMGLSPNKARISKPKIDPIQSFSQASKAHSFDLKGTAEKSLGMASLNLKENET